MSDAKRVITLVNPQGLHARPSSKIVLIANRYQAQLTLRVEDRSADGKSIMEVMMLECPFGADIELEATGPDASELVEELAVLIGSGFGEKT